ncbi:MAG: DUF1934 domain-containing protein [Clostridia bacterium]|nr:DUF1934 domain-containing protein [Clostridia bacterium]MDO5302455.1 DUF1934 domain-containing protein [Clostridia bacterium]
MKDIMLKITGKLLVGEEAEDRMEFVTEGKLYERGGAKYLMYEESEFSGMPGCKTTLKLTDSSIRLKRIGDQAGPGNEMVFEKGKRYNSRYSTPYGDMDLEILTNDVVNNLSEEGFGTIGIDYHVSLGGMAEGRNQLNIEVLQ